MFGIPLGRFSGLVCQTIFTHDVSICSNKESCPAWLNSCSGFPIIISSFDKTNPSLYYKRLTLDLLSSKCSFSRFHSVRGKKTPDCRIRTAVYWRFYSSASLGDADCIAVPMVWSNKLKMIFGKIQFIEQNENIKMRQTKTLRFLTIQMQLAIWSRENKKFQTFLFTKCVHSYNLFILSLNVPI